MSLAQKSVVQDEQGRWRYLLSWEQRKTAERWARVKSSEGEAVEVAVVALADGSYTVTWWEWCWLSPLYRRRGSLRDVLERNWQPLREQGEITKAYKRHMGKRYYVALRRGTGREDDGLYHLWVQGVNEGPLENIEAIELWLLFECLCPLERWYPIDVDGKSASHSKRPNGVAPL
jgi:hypothetical protein